MSFVSKIFGGGTPKYEIKTDPAQVAAETRQANQAADLSNENIPNIQSGGQVDSANMTSTRRRRRTGSGLSSNLGL